MSPEIERRLRVLEDRAAIGELIARYGPAADAGDAEAVSALWATDGTYRFDDTELDADGIRSLTDLPSHRDYMRRGCAHFLSAPRIEIDGDRAVAVTHSVVLVRAGECWVAERVSANRWEFTRTGDGWRVQDRRNRLLDGSAEARAVLGGAPLTSGSD